MIKYPEKLVLDSDLNFKRLKKQFNRFELDSNAENAKYCSNNNKFIFLMPKYSRLKKMKQNRHVRTKYNKIFKEHSLNPANWQNSNNKSKNLFCKGFCILGVPCT